MKRLVCLVLMVSSAALARGNSRVEAQGVVDQLMQGSMGLNQAVNRLEFLGEAAWAANELATLLRRAGDGRGRTLLLNAIAALAVPGDEDVEKALLGALRSDDLSLRLAVVRGLGRMKSERAFAPLVQQLKDPSAAMRRESAKALGVLGARAGPPLATATKTEEDVDARVAMLVGLGRSGDRKQSRVLVPFLKDSSESTRLAAAQGLCLLGDAQGIAFAKGLLAGKTRAERLQGVLLFEGLGGRASAPLAAMLDDADHRVRAAAARVMYQEGDKSRLAWLVLASAKAEGDDKIAYEEQLEKLRLTDEDRAAILKRGK
jgi:HEAT repeat protein